MISLLILVLPLVLAQETTQFIQEVGGKCQTLNGGDPAHAWKGGIGFESCQSQCSEQSNCFGFSVASFSNCLHWLQSDIKGQGDAWGNADCYIKASGSSVPEVDYFSMTGDCDAASERNCVSSKNFPSFHGNHDFCSITMLRDAEVTVEPLFNLESYDRLVIQGRNVQSLDQVPEVLVEDDTITWTSDGSVALEGWKLCFQDLLYQPNAAFRVSGSGCDINSANTCVSTKNWPNLYGNDESCDIEILRDVNVFPSPIEIEAGFDKLLIGQIDIRVAGQIQPTLSWGETISWQTDRSVSHAGWQICFEQRVPRVVSGMCDLPRGSYEDSCHSCRLENCVLKCLCGMGQTTLDLKRRCRGQEVINLGGALACPISKQGSDLLDLYFPKGEAQQPIGFQDECVPEDLVRSSIETSQCVTKTNVFKPTSVETESVFNGFLWSFGQFVDHDLDLVAENHTEKVYSENHFFDLSVSNCDEEDMVGNRINVVSSAFDLSSVYNDAKPEIRSQVDPAFLAMHDIDELPIDDKGNYICGDDRCNENPFLTAQHTLWAKHHNIIVEELNYALSVEETQDRDAVYEKAKQINIATYQKVIMEEFVPTLVGNLDGEYEYQGHMHSYEIMEANKQCHSGTWLPLGDTKVTPKLCMHLITSLAHNGQCHGGYMSTSTTTGGCFCVTSDDCDMEPAPGIDTYRVGPQHDMSISPLFAGAAYRLHQLVQDTFELAPGRIDALSSHFFKPESFQQWGKLDGWVNRLLQTKSNKFGSHMSHSLKHALFCTDSDAECQNLAARNCMRGRDFDLPTLNEARELFGLPPYDSFDALLENCPELPTLYDWQIDDVELFIGGSCEDPVSGAVLGETFLQIVRDQFVRLRDGDRTYGGTDHPVEGGIYRNLRQVLETVTGSDQSSFHRSNIFLFEDAATTAPFDGRI